MKPKSRRKAIWMCGACGRCHEDRDKLPDVSCYVNAKLVWKDTIEVSDKGIYAMPLSKNEIKLLESK